MGAILINVGAILYGGDFEVGAILINVGAILTGRFCSWAIWLAFSLSYDTQWSFSGASVSSGFDVEDLVVDLDFCITGLTKVQRVKTN